MSLDRITHPLRLAAGSHQPGSGKGCAMNVISYINGDTVITDYPSCSARPLARLVQRLNDTLAGPDGFLSPENSLLVLDLGWRTVGTAGVSDDVVRRWLIEVLINPDWGAIRYADERGADCLREVARLHRSIIEGARADAATWAAARAAAWDAARDAVWAADWAADEDAVWAAACAAAGAAARAAARAADEDAVWAAACAAAGAAVWAAAGDIDEDAACAAACAAVWAAAGDAFMRSAIECWRRLAGLEAEPEIDSGEVEAALAKIG